MKDEKENPLLNSIVDKTSILPSISKISYESITLHLKKKLTAKEFETYLSLYKIAISNPSKNLVRDLLEFKNKHENLPEIYNLLTYVYLKLRKIKEGEKLIQETYEKFPNYLFAKINYADYCLRKKLIDKIPTIFHHTFDLSVLYPDRECFHYSEYRGFLVVMSFYHLAIGEKKKAELYFCKACEIDLFHPSLKILEKQLFKKPSLLKKIFSKLACFVKIF